ncbi:MAG: hypothetical protein AAGK37_19970 [Pseudomonadota bacterium]
MVRLQVNGMLRFVAALYAVSLALVSFAHDPTGANRPDAEISAFIQAGGSLADICATTSGEASDPECPACILAKSFADVRSAPEVFCQAKQRPTRVVRSIYIHAGAQIASTPPARGPPMIGAA